MKLNPKVLDEIELQVASQEPTEKEREEISAFIRQLKQKNKTRQRLSTGVYR
jgi:hypothetical protein